VFFRETRPDRSRAGLHVVVWMLRSMLVVVVIAMVVIAMVIIMMTDDHTVMIFVMVMNHDDLAMMIPIVIPVMVADVDGYAFLRHHHRLVAGCRSRRGRAQDCERARDQEKFVHVLFLMG
jgi:hypothetical protein